MKSTRKKHSKKPDSKTGNNSQTTHYKDKKDFMDYLFVEVVDIQKYEFILMKYNVFGYIGEVPTWILGEFNDFAKQKITLMGLIKYNVPNTDAK